MYILNKCTKRKYFPLIEIIILLISSNILETFLESSPEFVNKYSMF